MAFPANHHAPFGMLSPPSASSRRSHDDMEAEIFALKMALDESRQKSSTSSAGGGADVQQLREALLERDQLLQDRDQSLQVLREELAGEQHQRSEIELRVAGLTRDQKATLRTVQSLESNLSAREELCQRLDERVRGLGEKERKLEAEVADVNARKLDVSQRARALKEALEVKLAAEERAHATTLQKLQDAQGRLEVAERSNVEIGELMKKQDASYQDTIQRHKSKLSAASAATDAAAAAASESQRALEQAGARAEVERKGANDREKEYRSQVTALAEEAGALRRRLDSSLAEGRRARIAAEEEVSRTKQERDTLHAQVEQLRLENAGLQSKQGEVARLRHENQELREKVVRQDAAWKRKLERERKSGRGGVGSGRGGAGSASGALAAVATNNATSEPSDGTCRAESGSKATTEAAATARRRSAQLGVAREEKENGTAPGKTKISQEQIPPMSSKSAVQNAKRSGGGTRVAASSKALPAKAVAAQPHGTSKTLSTAWA